MYKVKQAKLTLEDGTVFMGKSFGSEKSVAGEVVFCGKDFTDGHSTISFGEIAQIDVRGWGGCRLRVPGRHAAGGGFLSIDPEHAAVPGDCGYLLHSWKLRFPHPEADTMISIVSPPPAALLPL